MLSCQISEKCFQHFPESVPQRFKAVLKEEEGPTSKFPYVLFIFFLQQCVTYFSVKPIVLGVFQPYLCFQLTCSTEIPLLDLCTPELIVCLPQCVSFCDQTLENKGHQNTLSGLKIHVASGFLYLDLDAMQSRQRQSKYKYPRHISTFPNYTHK